MTAARIPKKKKPRAMPAKKKRAAKSPAKSAMKNGGGAWAEFFVPRTPGERRYWLVKSEPEVFSFDDLLRAQNKTDAAQQSEVRFRKAWAKADVTLAASRF